MMGTARVDQPYVLWPFPLGPGPRARGKCCTAVRCAYRILSPGADASSRVYVTWMTRIQRKQDIQLSTTEPQPLGPLNLTLVLSCSACAIKNHRLSPHPKTDHHCPGILSIHCPIGDFSPPSLPSWPTPPPLLPSPSHRDTHRRPPIHPVPDHYKDSYLFIYRFHLSPFSISTLPCTDTDNLIHNHVVPCLSQVYLKEEKGQYPLMAATLYLPSSITLAMTKDVDGSGKPF